jgi:DNA-binding transcriptional LysR family regulator
MSRARLRRYFRHGLFPQLIVFEAVARLGSVTRAAEELHLAQPTVSMQLKKLAGALDLTLFEPDGRGLRLTAAGEALQTACGELVQMFGRIDERLEQFRENARRKDAEVLRIAAEPEARAVASRLVAAFCARHPGVRASVHIAERGELLQRLATNVDDVYLFELEIDGLPVERRWSVAHAKGRDLARTAALFVREALQSGAYEAGPRADGASQGGAILG